MSKTTAQVIADMRHGLSVLESLNNQKGGNRRFDNNKALEAENKNLKARITTLNKSNGQFKGIADRKTKQALRLQSENEKLLALIASLQEEIKLHEVLEGTRGFNIVSV